MAKESTQTVPRHYHVWVPALNGKGMVMLSAKMPSTEIARQRERGSRRVVRHWWKSRTGARKALESAGR